MLLHVTNTPFFTSVKVVLKFAKQRLYCVTPTSEEIYKTQFRRHITHTGIHHVTFSIYVVQFSMFHNKKLIYGNCTNMVLSWGVGVKI